MSESEGGPQESARYYDSVEVRALRALAPDSDDSIAIRARAHEALALSFIDEELASRAIPERIFAHKPCAQYERPPRRSAVDVTSESRRPKSRSRSRPNPSKQGNRRFDTPFRSKTVVAQGQGRVDCRGRAHHPRGLKDQGRVCPLSRCTHTSPVCRFPCIRPYVATRGNEEGSCFLEKPPEQEDTKSSPSSSMELKFELDTRLTVSCVVAVALAYGLVTVSIALDSILLVFGNAVILLLILFVLFGWRELLGQRQTKVV